MSASASDGTHSQQQSVTPLNVSQHTDNSPRGRNDSVLGCSAQDSPRRDSTYQVAARKSRSSQHEKKESKKQEPANNGESVRLSDRPKFDIGWERAALGYFEENLLEQKMWIQCTLKGAKQRGEDWIDSRFIDEKQANSGCSACLYANLVPFTQHRFVTSVCRPDIVIVNDDKIKKGSDAFRSKFEAPWQRVWTEEEAKKETNNSYKAPSATNRMPCCAAPAVPDTLLYDEKRFVVFLFAPVLPSNQHKRHRSCTWFQRCCAFIYMSRIFEAIFRGGKSVRFPKVEPAQVHPTPPPLIQSRAFFLNLLRTFAVAPEV
jgi:hypothetical protein